MNKLKSLNRQRAHFAHLSHRKANYIAFTLKILAILAVTLLLAKATQAQIGTVVASNRQVVNNRGTSEEVTSPITIVLQQSGIKLHYINSNEVFQYYYTEYHTKPGAIYGKIATADNHTLYFYIDIKQRGLQISADPKGQEGITYLID